MLYLLQQEFPFLDFAVIQEAYFVINDANLLKDMLRVAFNSAKATQG